MSAAAPGVPAAAGASKLANETANLETAFGAMAADIESHRHRLLALSRGLESLFSARAAELARESEGIERLVAERVAQLSSANEALRLEAAELARRNREITLIGRMTDFLQSACSEAEAHGIVADTAAQLFAGDSGALFVFGASRNLLEAAAVWGAHPPDVLVFPPDQCWAQRRGQAHLGIGRAHRCGHVAGDAPAYLCQPLSVQGESAGILHLLDGQPDGCADEARAAAKAALLKRLADSAGLGLAGLRMRETMRKLSIRDPLTGLFNRRYLEEALALEQHRATRSDTLLAAIMIDIDHFKRFNDDFGHDCGDAVLRALGAFLRGHVRGSDVACRYGGEEFVLLLSPTTAAGAAARAESIRRDAAQLAVGHLDRRLDGITLSLGVALFPVHGAGGDALLKAADMALYEAKAGGRNRVVMARQAELLQAPPPA